MKKSKLLSSILNIFSISIYMIAGIVIILFFRDGVTFDNQIIGWVLIVTAVIRITRALMEKGTIDERPYELAIPMIHLGFGFVALFAHLPMSDLVLYWGFIEIASSSIEMIMAVRIVRKNVLHILNVLINVVEFVFGILLCVHLEEGITIHLIITGSLFITIALEEIILMVLESRLENKHNEQQN